MTPIKIDDPVNEERISREALSSGLEKVNQKSYPDILRKMIN